MAKSPGRKPDARAKAGGRQTPLEKSEQDTLIRLGAAVLEIWDHLPRERQQVVFRAATAKPGSLDLARLRRRMAVVLHAHHERTAQPRTSGRRGGSDPPPAGPHARPELTNLDATPGSGLFHSGKTRGGEVDPGGG